MGVGASSETKESKGVLFVLVKGTKHRVVVELDESVGHLRERLRKQFQQPNGRLLFIGIPLDNSRPVSGLLARSLDFVS